MSKPREKGKPVPPLPEIKPNGVEPIGVSNVYFMKQYGLYEYQLYALTSDMKEKKLGPMNTFGVVGSGLLDLLFSDLHKVRK